jgi:F-type H+-transporting ATPase subunit delta
VTRPGAIARRYARALLAVGHERGSARAVLSELGTLTEEILESDPLRRALFAPIHPRAERASLLADLAGRLGLSPELLAFGRLLVEENRVALLPAIRDALERIVEREEGRVVAQVTSARLLTQEEIRRLSEALSRRVGARVTLSLDVDERILGGVVARVGDLLLDGSVRTQLSSLAESLRRGP